MDVVILVSHINISILCRYWDICPLENLLAQMEVDKPIVAKAVAKLLIPSIFPKVTILFGKLLL